MNLHIIYTQTSPGLSLCSLASAWEAISTGEGVPTGHGGGLYVEEARVLLKGCRMWGNTGVGLGGALSLQSPVSARAEQTIFEA